MSKKAEVTPQDLIRDVFTLARLWERTFDQAFAPDGITVKQFFLMAALHRSFAQPPTLGEAADELIMSYQNVKKLALQLQDRGFVELAKDGADRRVVRIRITDECRRYWSGRSQNDDAAFGALFRKVSEQRIRKTHKALRRLIKNSIT